MLERIDDQAPRATADPGPAAGAPAPTLLVIDDDTVHRMIIGRVAARAGYTATEAASYEEAVALLRGNAYTLITLDLTLGQHGGAEVLHVIAAMDLKTPIVIVSSSNETIRRETAAMANLLSLNVCRALAKPVDLGELRRILLDVRQRSAIGLMPAGWSA
ncbi:MAG: response regulator [Rhodoplanes sp.]|uniref:response regulator n=1 Tax=Rhodoplanes sp. TaxID=1968906 RepID=UPI0017E11A3A|nr:response regulator [Rhodoplanes sp.]NVO14348.1 response regulator [Rhodoplanes sp.]